MINDLRRPGTTPPGPEARPRPAPEHSAFASLIQDLVWLRELVLERLTSIETLAAERPASAPSAQERTALEESFKMRSDELEETRRRLHEQAEREKRDWSASLSQLEEDRRFLAEAWERVEQARIDSSSAPRPSLLLHSQGQDPQTAGSNGQSRTGASIPIRSAGGDSDPHNPVNQAILQQFQLLCSDARHSARGRHAAR
jgi:hypothetical protein